MSNDLNLDGGEISVIKALGLSGGEKSGEVLMDLVKDQGVAELIDTLKCLIALGYVVSDKNSFHSSEELRKASFHINSGYFKELKEALDPQPEKKSKRVRRE